MKTEIVMDCGGKRSATPLSHERMLRLQFGFGAPESGVAAALCHRSPRMIFTNNNH